MTWRPRSAPESEEACGQIGRSGGEPRGGQPRLFEQMGAIVIEGGQGENPSAADLARAVEENRGPGRRGASHQEHRPHSGASGRAGRGEDLRSTDDEHSRWTRSDGRIRPRGRARRGGRGDARDLRLAAGWRGYAFRARRPPRRTRGSRGGLRFLHGDLIAVEVAPTRRHSCSRERSWPTTPMS